MPYEFSDVGDLTCAEIARAHRALLLGHRAICSSFDSGRFDEPSWDLVEDHRVSPPITDALIDSWPVSHDGRYDEWWIFDGPAPADFKVKAFCNFGGMRIAGYRELNFEGGCRLDQYLQEFRPLLVLGNNQASAYFIRRTLPPAPPPAISPKITPP